MKDYGILKLLCETPGISGHEAKVSEVVKNIFQKYCDEIIVDEFYNVAGFIKAKKLPEGQQRPFRMMFVAHIDEIGMVVSKYEKNGFLRLSKVSGIDPKTLLSAKLNIHTSKHGIIKGVVGSIPPHLLNGSEKDKAVMLKDIFVDTGYSEEDVRKMISIGDPVTFDTDLIQLKDCSVSGKALDNRCSIFALYNMLQRLSNEEFENDLIIVASVREEENSFGAYIASYSIEPDLAIAVDVTHGKPGKSDNDDKDQMFPLGKGPVICKAPILNSKITEMLYDICSDLDYTQQIEVDNSDTGTDASELFVASKGIPVAVLSIPLKYMHTQTEVADIRDIEGAGEVLAEFACLSNEEVRELLCY